MHVQNLNNNLIWASKQICKNSVIHLLTAFYLYNNIYGELGRLKSLSYNKKPKKRPFTK